MHSGKNGAVLFTVNGDTKGDRFGAAVAGLGDLNGDGYPDFAVGAYQSVLISAPGYVKFFSGKDGTMIRKIIGAKIGDAYGHSLSSAGDLNGDKVPDILVGASQRNNSGPGYVIAYSGKDFTVLRTIPAPGKAVEFGLTVSGGSDLDRDGVPDILVGAPASTAAGTNSGSAFGYSGKTWGLLFTVNGDSVGDNMGESVAFVGDVDRDGYPDLGLGAPGDNAGGSLHVLSGKDRTRLYRFDGDSANDRLGTAVAPLGDLNRDGHADFIAGIPSDDNTGNSTGAARVFSGRALTFWSDTHKLSLKRAGTQKLTLAAGASHARRSYQIFGSATGAFPGVRVAGVQVPLNIDVYTEVAMAHVNGAVFANFRGTLDGKGNASASFNVPSSLPAALDTTLFHAYLVYDAGGIYMASDPVTLRLEN